MKKRKGASLQRINVENSAPRRENLLAPDTERMPKYLLKVFKTGPDIWVAREAH